MWKQYYLLDLGLTLWRYFKTLLLLFFSFFFLINLFIEYFYRPEARHVYEAVLSWREWSRLEWLHPHMHLYYLYYSIKKIFFPKPIWRGSNSKNFITGNNVLLLSVYDSETWNTFGTFCGVSQVKCQAAFFTIVIKKTDNVFWFLPNTSRLCTSVEIKPLQSSKKILLNGWFGSRVMVLRQIYI